MLQIHAAVLAVLHILILAPGLKINPECSIGYGLGGSKHHLIFLPLRARDLNHLIVEHLVLILGIIIAQVESDKLFLGRFGFLAERRCTCPHCESVLFTLLNAHAEVALVLQAAEHHGVSGVTKTNIVRTALKRTVITNLHIAESSPTHKRVVKLKRAVLYKLRIESAVGSIVYILKEQTVHGLLHRNAGVLSLYLKRRLGQHESRYSNRRNK